MKSKKLKITLCSIAVVAAILFAPEKGSDLRARIKRMLKEKGIDFSDDDVSELVDQITAEIEDSKA